MSICDDCLSQKKNGICVVTADCGCNCHNTLVHPEYAHYKTAEELVRYQNKVTSYSPCYPAKIKDYPKLSPEVLTKKGLEFLKIYERKLVWDTITDPEYYIYVELVRVWSFTNPTSKRVKKYYNIYNHYLSTPRKVSGIRQGFCPEHDEDGIREEWSTVKQGLTIPNPEYDQDFTDRIHQWSSDLLMECHRLNHIERRK